MGKFATAKCLVLSVGILLVTAFFPGQDKRNQALAAPLDEAQKAGRDDATLVQADEDYFHDMDNGVALSEDEIKGRNMWLVWTGGNDRQWDELTRLTFGAHDLLKILTSHPSQTYCYGPCNRDSRWSWLGAINEPCFEKPTGPDPESFGLWLDVRRKDCPPDSFENEEK